MENTDSKKDYKAPQAKVIEVKVQSVLCQSGSNEGYSNTNDPEWF